ncbi:MAG: alpha/beta hydrolase family protein [Patescibacteria group bacterium]
MNKKTKVFFLAGFLLSAILIFVFYNQFWLEEEGREAESEIAEKVKKESIQKEIKIPKKEEEKSLSSMAIEELQERNFPGGDFVVEEKLENGSNYERFIVSYQSEGLKINGLLTRPLSPRPEGGYPAILFVHGYIPPKQYSTVDSYPTYQASLARQGFVTFKPDMRGHGDSEGEPVNAHFSEKYVVDTLHALAYLKDYEDANSERIGYWGHSNGGEIGLRSAVITDEIKAYSFWAGVVGSYKDMLETYNQDIPFLNLEEKEFSFVQENGLPSENPDFWNKIDPHRYLEEISAPIELHHGTDDDSVPIELSVSLKEAMEEEDKKVDLYEYADDDHDISQNSNRAFERTIKFYEENL